MTTYMKRVVLAFGIGIVLFAFVALWWPAPGAHDAEPRTEADSIAAGWVIHTDSTWSWPYQRRRTQGSCNDLPVAFHGVTNAGSSGPGSLRAALEAVTDTTYDYIIVGNGRRLSTDELFPNNKCVTVVPTWLPPLRITPGTAMAIEEKT